MFGTLRYEPQEDGISYHSGTGQHYACDNCRARKLKCGGQKTRCTRCRNSDIECVYTEPTQGSRKRTKRADNVEDGSKQATDRRPRSPKKQSTAIQADESANPELPWTVYNIERDDHGPSAGGPSNSKNSDIHIPYSSSIPSVPSLDDESLASETLSQYILPGLSPDGVDENPWLPTFSNDSMIGDQDAFFQELFAIPNLKDCTEGPKCVSSTDQLRNRSTPIKGVSGFSMSPQRQLGVLQNQGSYPSESSLNQDLLNRSSPKRVHPFSKDFKDIPDPNQHSSSSSQSPESCASLEISSKRRSKDCECLQLTLTLLEDFDIRDSTREPQRSLDSILIHQRDALAQCIDRVKCPACSQHMEFLTLLRLVSSKIIATYESIIKDHTANVLKRTNAPRAPANHAGEEDEPPIQQNTLTSQALSLGSYHVDRPEDWDYVVCILIALQLKQASTLISRMLSLPDNSCKGSQTNALKLLRQRLGNSLKNIKKLTLTDRLSEIAL